MGLKEQERLLSALEGFIARQDEAMGKLAGSVQVHKQGEGEQGGERGGGELGGKSGEIASSSFKHGAIASSSFHLNQEEMEQLRKDIKASASTDNSSADAKGQNGASVANGNKKEAGKSGQNGDDADDTSNLAFVSPLVDGRLVDVARQQT